MARSRMDKDPQKSGGGRTVLPGWWKASIYISTTWTAIGAWLYISGTWSAKLHDCTVEISSLDSFMSDSVMIAGLFSVFSILAAFTLLEK